MTGRRAVTHLPLIVVLGVVLAGLIRISQANWREGSLLVGGAMLLAAGFRAVLDPGRTGLLAVRGRSVDVLTYGALGVMIIYVAATIEGGPFDR